MSGGAPQHEDDGGGGPLRPAPLEGEVVGRVRPVRRAGGGAGGRHAEMDEGPTPRDVERFSGVTRTCPSCRKEVFDDADLCYHCGYALDAPEERTGPPLWVYVAGGLALIALLYPLLAGGSWRVW